MKNNIFLKNKNIKENLKNKKAQISIFVILGIIIIGGIALFFILRSDLFKTNIPSDLKPVYDYYISCIEEQAETGLFISESKGGYIESPDFSPGSMHMPFSNQLDFFGIGVPYWYYVSGNGVSIEQIPSRTNIQNQLNKYISENLYCDFSDFERQGFEVELSEATAKTSISDNLVSVDLNQRISISKEEISWTKNTHLIKVNTNFGKLYDLARKIYSNQRASNFLEEYGIDVLRLYAPVDGVELTCAPLVWNQQEIKQELVTALEPNVQAIKLRGDYYTLKDKTNYFVRDIGENVDVNVNFLYSKTWPTKINIYPDENPLIAEAVGPQQGLGVLGFCYVPYHFVYDFAYPVLIQLSSGSNTFQFPIIVVIDKNKPLEGLNALPVEEPASEFCKYSVQEFEVYTYDIDLEPIEARISIECIQETCDIGKTKIQGNKAVLVANFPQCHNAYIVAKAEGYANKRYLASTNTFGVANIVLDKLYPVEIDLKVDGTTTSDFAIISFASEQTTAAVSWPSQKSVNLSAGEYSVQVQVYRNSSILIPAVNQEQCVEAPKSGLLGLFGMTEEKCFNINIPAQTIPNAISGGGKSKDYFIESMLEKGKIEINVDSLPVPRTLEDLEQNYYLLEVKSVYTDFKDE
jgi:hypothetical protein